MLKKLVFLAIDEKLYFEVRLVEFRKRLNMQTRISQLLQLSHELCLAIIAQDISIIAQHYYVECISIDSVCILD